MKKLLFIPTMILAIIVAAIAPSTQSALAGGIGNNYIAPAVTFGGGSTVFGLDSKIGVANNFSVRPFITFPSGGTEYGASLTYDWDLRQSPTAITPFLGLGFEFQNTGGRTTNNAFGQVGADFNINDGVALLTSIGIPFNGGDTNVTVGAGIRF
jgi:hypothetical protein